MRGSRLDRFAVVSVRGPRAGGRPDQTYYVAEGLAQTEADGFRTARQAMDARPGKRLRVYVILLTADNKGAVCGGLSADRYSVQGVFPEDTGSVRDLLAVARLSATLAVQADIRYGV